MAAPLSPAGLAMFGGAFGPVVTDSELERSMARAAMTLGAGLLSAGLIWQLSKSGGPRSLLIIGGAISAFGWAWYSRAGGEAAYVDGDGQVLEGELV